MHKIVICILLAFTLSFSFASETSEVVFVVPVGDPGISYEGGKVPESPVNGPSTLAIAADGTFWIADSVGRTLLQYKKDGTLVKTITAAKYATDISDVCVTRREIFILDMAATHPTIWQLDLEGTLVAKYPSPVTLAAGLSGIAYSPKDGLLLEQEGGAKFTQLLDVKGKKRNRTLRGYFGRFQILKGQKRGIWKIGKRAINVDVRHRLAGLRALKIRKSGALSLIVDEMAINSAIKIDQTIRRYDAQGKLLGIARIPLSERYAFVANGVAEGREHVYTLVTRPDRVEVHRLIFKSKLEPILSDAPEALKTSAKMTTSAVTILSISRSTIMSNAAAYVNNSKYLNSTNINGSCSGRSKPAYLGSAGTYSSVPYDWGGWDSISNFNNYMDSNYTAGDVHTSGVESCSRGVDCSGFVTRAWGITSQKYGTSTLSQISTQLGSTNDLLDGDIMNKSGSHVRLFASFSGSGGYFYEATTSSNYDRVVYRYLSWSYFSGYAPRRYNNVTGSGGTTPPPSVDTWPTHSTTVNNSGNNVYAIQYLLRQEGQSVSVNGSFGSSTKSAVQSVQSANGLSCDGVVGSQTWQQALITTVSQGSLGDAVKAVQHLLKYKFGYSLSVDGDFGPITHSTVVSFQQSESLTVDGIVGPQTWLALVTDP